MFREDRMQRSNAKIDWQHASGFIRFEFNKLSMKSMHLSSGMLRSSPSQKSIGESHKWLFLNRLEFKSFPRYIWCQYRWQVPFGGIRL